MAPNVGAVGSLAIFLFLTAATLIVALTVLSYAGYSFMVALVGTAAGNDEIDWPGEPFTDWLWMLWYLLWIAAVWAAPAVLVLAPLRFSLPWFLVLVGAVIWALFPISLLSSLSASSRWVLYRPKIMALFFRHFGTALGFYLLTAVIGTMTGALLYFGLRGPLPVILVPLTAAAAATSLLIYARLLGRMGHLISWQPLDKGSLTEDERPEEADRIQILDPWAVPETSRPRRKEAVTAPLAARPPRAKKIRKRAGSQSYDPWAVPEQPIQARPRPRSEPEEEEVEDSLGPVRGSYDLMQDDQSWPHPAQPPPAPPPSAAREPPGSSQDAYDLAPEGASLPAPLNPELPQDLGDRYAITPREASGSKATLPPDVSGAAKREEELARPRERVPPPARLLTGGVLGFPFYSASRNAWSLLVTGFLAVTALVRILIAINPFPDLGY